MLKSLNELAENKILELKLLVFSLYFPNVGSTARLATMTIVDYDSYIFFSVLGSQITLELETWVIKKVFPQ